MVDLRLGMVGLGMRGALFELAHRPGRGSRVAAVCDPDPARLAAAARVFGDDVLLAADLDDLLAGVDGARSTGSACSPPTTCTPTWRNGACPPGYRRSWRSRWPSRSRTRMPSSTAP